MNEVQYATATPVEVGELSTVSLELNQKAQIYKELLRDLYGKVESIKPFPPGDMKALDNPIESGLIGELRSTKDFLTENNDLLRFIIQHLNTIV